LSLTSESFGLDLCQWIRAAEAIVIDYLFVGLANDRIAARCERASLIDPLTGVANRCGFFETGELLLLRGRLDRICLNLRSVRLALRCGSLPAVNADAAGVSKRSPEP
jgi:hypothetical protein